jgi:hypothetical protein
MACTAELQTRWKVFDEHRACTASMGLVAAQAAKRSFNLARICRIVNITDRMPPHGVSDPVLQFESNDLFLRKVVFRKLHFAVEDRNRVTGLIGGVSDGCTVTFRAECIAIGAKELCPFSAMRIVARRAALLENRLMQYALVLQLLLISVAVETDVYRILLRISARLASVWIMTIRAVALCSWMWELGGFDPRSLIGMTAHAKSFNALLRKNNFAVLGWLVTDIAQFFSEGRMYEGLHQLWPIGLVRVVTANAV